MGAVMPLTIRIYTASAAGAGRDVGVAYALNTVGAIAGSFAAGFIVLPWLGLQRGLLMCSGITAALSVVLLWNGERRSATGELGGTRHLLRPAALGLTDADIVGRDFATLVDESDRVLARAPKKPGS